MLYMNLLAGIFLYAWIEDGDRDYHAFKLFKFFKICTYIMIIIPVKLV